MKIDEIGEYIFMRRRYLGLTQDQLAEKSGCSRTNITNIERCSYHPSLKMLYGIAEALGLAVEIELSEKKG